jgi:hypothetical protein
MEEYASIMKNDVKRFMGGGARARGKTGGWIQMDL